MPPELYEQIAELARQERRSVNKQIVYMLELLLQLTKKKEKPDED